MPAIKIVDFTSGQSWAILPSKMVRRPEPNLLHCDVSLCVPVCLHLEIQRLRECQVILNRIVSHIFGVVLMKILRRTMRMMLKKALTHKLTSRVVSRDVLTAPFKCHFWGKNSLNLRACKINNFHRRHPRFWNCVFQTLYFHIMWKKFSLHRHFKIVTQDLTFKTYSQALGSVNERANSCKWFDSLHLKKKMQVMNRLGYV